MLGNERKNERERNKYKWERERTKEDGEREREKLEERRERDRKEEKMKGEKKRKRKRFSWRLVSVMVHTRIAEGQEGVGRDAGAAHKGAAWSGPTIASPLQALQCPTTASLPERIGPASKRESSSASDLGYQIAKPVQN